MKLMIVDDEESSIMTVRHMIDMDEFHIDRCYTARSVQDAKTQIQKEPIDILLCDIEMPQENGLELLAWIRQEKMPIECIIMTCYAEFDYAQKALSLGSLAYLLKPIKKAELEKVLNSAITSKKDKDRLLKNSHSWINNQDTIRANFWLKLFRGEILTSRNSVENWLKKESICLELDWKYCPMLFVVRKWSNTIDNKDTKDTNLYRFALMNILDELFSILNMAEVSCDVFQIGQDAQLVVLGTPSDVPLKEALIQAKCNEYIQYAQAYFKIDINGYIGFRVSPWDIGNEIEDLYQMDYINIWTKSEIHDKKAFGHMSKNSSLSLEFEEFELWLKDLLDLNFSGTKHEMESFLDKYVEKKTVNMAWLESFHKQYMITLGAYGVIKKININKLLIDESGSKLAEESEVSILGLKRWIRYSLDFLNKMTLDQEKNRDPVEETIEYIDSHLSDELDMEVLANNVHLNPDYLTRIFKKSKGEPISKYIASQRIGKAKKLLESTNQPISEIAYQIGYFNYTSFNRMFTKTEGISPQAYRQQIKR